MDASWGWGILFGLAAAVPSAMIGIHQDVGWWSVIASPLPLVLWTAAWVSVGKPSRVWRIAIITSVSPICIGIVIFGVHGLFADAHAQTPPSVNGDCSAGSVGGNFSPNCPKTYNSAPPRKPNGIYQDGRFLGTVDGVQVSDDHKHVTLKNPNISGPGIDPTGNFELQKFIINCPAFAQAPRAVNLNFSMIGNTVCDIVGLHKP